MHPAQRAALFDYFLAALFLAPMVVGVVALGVGADPGAALTIVGASGVALGLAFWGRGR